MRPLLAALADEQEHSVTSIYEGLAEHFSLSQEELDEKIPSARAKTFRNRVGWATTYLFRTGLIARPKRAVYSITARGKDILAKHPDRVDLKVLAQFDEFQEFRAKKPSAGTEDAGTGVSDDGATPEEQIDSAYQQFRSALAAGVLDRVAEQSPDFFEQLVLDVLHAMGYGGTRDDATHLGKSGDEGVDGVIREDELGLDLIYVQAKLWKNPVGRPEIQKFFGALHGQRATKGVFITTSTFTSEATSYAENVSPRVTLIDGKRLARLMIDYGVGVTVEHRYELKRVDLAYFGLGDGEPAEPIASN